MKSLVVFPPSSGTWYNTRRASSAAAATCSTDEVTCLTLLPDGLRFVSSSYDKTVRIAYHGLAPHRQ